MVIVVSKRYRVVHKVTTTMRDNEVNGWNKETWNAVNKVAEFCRQSHVYVSFL